MQPLPENPTQKRPASINPETRWRTPTQERIYGQRLLQALKSTKNSSSQPSKMTEPRVIKEAADSALALTAKGQTRWSRAILSRQWRNRKLWLKAGGKIRRCSSSRTRTRTCVGKSGLGLGSGSSTDSQQLPRKGEKVTERLRVLSRLVPGCRKISTPTLLEEATDYVAALQMQVKTMRTLADLLSSATLNPDVEREGES